jgi:hypothetical protein
MGEGKKIRGIRVNMSGFNNVHETTDDLICDVCGKKTGRVIVIYPPCNENDVRFSCFPAECFDELFSEMLTQYDDEFLYACCIEDIKFPKKKETKKKTRSKMTLKLRYKILKRDNFQCVICGRRPPDVELCVDHIIPVAKGGTSEENNLRTLCTDCNLGKGVET